MVQKHKDVVDKTQHCHTCRRQRLRCDGVRPTCNKCVARGVDCLGYGTQALLWVRPQSAQPGPSSPSSSRTENEQTTTATMVTDDGSVPSTPKDTHYPQHQQQQQGRKKGRPKLVLMERTESELAMPNGQGLELRQRPETADLNAYMREMTARGFHTHQLQRRSIVVSPALDPAGYQQQRLIIDSLRYYDEHVSSDLVLFDTPNNPFKLPVEFWSYVPDLVTDPLVSVAAVHRISKTQSDLELAAYMPGYKVGFQRNRLLSVKHPLVPVVFRHQQRMAGALASMVADPELCGNRGLVEAITTMILCEVQQSLFGDWDKHLNGAQAIIAARGGVKTLAVDEVNPVNFDICTVMQVEVMRDFGSPSCLLRCKAAMFDDYLTYIVPIYKDGWLAGFPCTNFLMTCLIRINLARYEDYQDPGTIVAKLAKRRSLLESIVNFSPPEWLESRMPQLATVFGERARDMQRDSVRAALLDLIQAFQMCTMLYAIRTLFLDNGIFALLGGGADGDMEHQARARLPHEQASEGSGGGDGGGGGGIIDLRQAEATAIEVLHASLRRIWATEAAAPDWFGKFTVWPLFMLGMSIDPARASAATRDFVCRSLLRLGHHMGSMAYKDAIWAMQHTWEEGAGKAERSAWLGELPLDVLPGLFFV